MWPVGDDEFDSRFKKELKLTNAARQESKSLEHCMCISAQSSEVIDRLVVPGTGPVRPKLWDLVCSEAP